MRTYGGRGRVRRKACRKAEGRSTPDVPVLSPDESNWAGPSPDRSAIASTPSTPASVRSLDPKPDRYVFLTLSPSEGYKRTRKKQRLSLTPTPSLDEESSAAEDENDENPATEQGPIPLKASSRSILARRMAPRPERMNVSPIQLPMHTSLPPVHRSASDQGPVPTPSPPFPNRVPCVTAGRPRYGEDRTSTREVKHCTSSKTRRSAIDVSEMQGRWHDLDEMNSSEEEAEDTTKGLGPFISQKGGITATLRSLSSLRCSGESQQFREDFNYLTSGLTSNSKPSVRQRICRQIVALVYEDGETSQADGGFAPLQGGSFLRCLRASALADVLCQRLVAIGAGDRSDRSVDTCAILLVLRMFDDPILAEELVGKGTVFKILLPALGIQALDELKYDVEDELQRWIRQARVLPDYSQSPDASILAMHALSRAFTQAATSPTLQQLLQPFQPELNLRLWSTFSERRLHLNSCGGAIIERSCCTILRAQELFHIPIEENETWAIPLVDMLETLPENPLAGSLDGLCAVSRLFVSLTHRKDVNYRTTLAKDSRAVRQLTRTFVTACEKSTATDIDAIETAKWMDIAALALATLTVLLEEEADHVSDALKAESHLLEQLGRLFEQQTRFTEKEGSEHIVILSRCLAVMLSLLIVRLKETADSSCILDHLTRGCCKISSVSHFRDRIVDCLGRFASVASAISALPPTRQPLGNVYDAEGGLLRTLSRQLAQLPLP